MTLSFKDLEKIIVVDLGSQSNQQVTRLVREANVYSEIMPSDTTAKQIQDEEHVIGVILSGGQPNTAKAFDPAILELGVPVLALESAGVQLVDGKDALETFTQRQVPTEAATTINVARSNANDLFDNLSELEVVAPAVDCWSEIADDYTIIATDADGKVQAVKHSDKDWYGLAFHPEVDQTPAANQLITNFVTQVCQANADWSMEQFIEIEIERIRQIVGDQQVLLGLSGGVDSSVVGVLLQRAIGDQLTCIFVDHGLLRKNEGDEVMTALGEFGLNIIRVDASERFLGKLAGVSDPEEKRKIIGAEFIHVFSDEAEKLAGVNFLAQGTLYSDVIESGFSNTPMVKSHHNVGGLPEDLQFELIEPLALLFKDEVRELGTALGMPDEIVWRQPFPGPGLGIRILGEITKEKLAIVRESDAILRQLIKEHGLEREIWQYFTVLTGIRSVGVSHSKRTYDYTIAIRAVHSVDGMTSDFAKIDWDILQEISQTILREVDGTNRVVYDISSKPPATIEWE